MFLLGGLLIGLNASVRCMSSTVSVGKNVDANRNINRHRNTFNNKFVAY